SETVRLPRKRNPHASNRAATARHLRGLGGTTTPPETRRGPGPYPPCRRLRHRPARLRRPPTVLHLPPRPWPRTRRRGTRTPGRRPQPEAGRRLCRRALSELRALPRLPAGKDQLLRTPASARRSHRRGHVRLARGAG